MKTSKFDNEKWERELTQSRADAEHREELLRWAREGHGQFGQWMKYHELCSRPLYAGYIKGNAALEKELDKILRTIDRRYRHQHSKSRFIRWITK